MAKSQVSRRGGLEVAYEKVDWISNPTAQTNNQFISDGSFYAQSYKTIDFFGVQNDAAQEGESATMHTPDGELSIDIKVEADDQRGLITMQVWPLSNTLGHYNIGTEHNSVSHSVNLLVNQNAIIESFYCSFFDLDSNVNIQEFVDVSGNDNPGPFPPPFGWTALPHPQFPGTFNFTETAGLFEPNGLNQNLVISPDVALFDGLNRFKYKTFTNLTTPASGSGGQFHATYYRPLLKASVGWVNYAGKIVQESDAAFHTREELITAGLLSANSPYAIDFAPIPKWLLANDDDTKYELIRQSPNFSMDLTDITATNTNLIIGTEAAQGQVALRSGSITRYGLKAHCHIEFEMDEDDIFDLIFGTSIVPAGSEIVGASFVASNIGVENANFKRVALNTLQVNRNNNINNDNTVFVSFWVDGLADFVGYTIQEA